MIDVAIEVQGTHRSLFNRRAGYGRDLDEFSWQPTAHWLPNGQIGSVHTCIGRSMSPRPVLWRQGSVAHHQDDLIAGIGVGYGPTTDVGEGPGYPSTNCARASGPRDAELDLTGGLVTPSFMWRFQRPGMILGRKHLQRIGPQLTGLRGFGTILSTRGQNTEDMCLSAGGVFAEEPLTPRRRYWLIGIRWAGPTAKLLGGKQSMQNADPGRSQIKPREVMHVKRTGTAPLRTYR